MLGQRDDQIVLTRLQHRQQLPFGTQLAQRAQLFPLPVYGMQLRQRRVAGQHLARVVVHQRVYLGVRGVRFQRRQNRRGQ